MSQLEILIQVERLGYLLQLEILIQFKWLGYLLQLETDTN